MLPRQTLRKYALPFVVSFAVVFLLDTLTNSVTEKYLYDSNVYLGIAKHGFKQELLIAPFVYRYAEPFLAGAIHHIVGLSIYKSFKTLTYVGSISQLMGIFFIVDKLIKSEKSAYAGMLAVSFSMYNLKFLLFDVYRPDVLAYPIILLCSWFVFEKKFIPLLFTTMVGLQFREFSIIPLLAFLVIRIRHAGVRNSLRELFFSVVGMSVAIGLPRVLIPIVKNGQDVNLSLDGISQAINMLRLWRRDVNMIFICFAYFLPFLILYRPSRIKVAKNELRTIHWQYLLYYSLLVLFLTSIGGTDMERFASFFFLPLAILVGLFVKKLSFIKIFVVLFLQFIFNRIWLPFPIWDFDVFINFYGGWSNIINNATLWRYAEVITLALIGNIVIHFKINSLPSVNRNIHVNEEHIKEHHDHS